MEDLDDEIFKEIIKLCHEDESVQAFLETMEKIPRKKESLVGRIFVSLCSMTSMGPKFRFFAQALLDDPETGSKINVNFLSPDGATALHMAAKNHDFELIRLLLSQGASTDTRGLPPQKQKVAHCSLNCDEIHYVHKIPLESAFFSTSCFHGLNPSDWATNSGGIFAIFVAHVAKEQHARESLKLLAAHTCDVGRAVYRCVKEGRPDLIALLLLVAHDTVSHVIGEAITVELAAVQEDKSIMLDTWANSSPLFRQLESKEQKLLFSLKILDVFNKAGDALIEFLYSKDWKIVADDVATFLKDFGCGLSYDGSTYGGSGEFVGCKDSIRCGLFRQVEEENKYHSECPSEYYCSISDPNTAVIAEKHIHHHACFGTGKAKSTFISFLKTIRLHKTTLVNCTLTYVLDAVFKLRKGRCYPIYKSCILSVLKGETGHSVDVNFLGYYGLGALHVAINHLNNDAVKMLLHHGADADIRAEKPDDVPDIQDGFHRDEQPAGKLPLELALSKGSICQDQLTGWTSDADELLSYFLDTLMLQADYIKLVELLASRTKGVEHVAVNCIKRGQVLPLGVLLLTAYERVISQRVSKESCSLQSKFPRCLPEISKFTMSEILQVSEDCLKIEEEGNSYTRAKELELRKDKLMFALLMLEVFGDALRKYGKVGVQDVFHVLRDEGFSLRSCMRNIQQTLLKFKDFMLQPQDSTETVGGGSWSSKPTPEPEPLFKLEKLPLLISKLKPFRKFPEDIPESKSWEECLPDVTSQDGCNCCWAVVAAHVIYSIFKALQLEEFMSSIQQLLDCLEPKRKPQDWKLCYLATFEEAFKWIMNNGICKASDYPFKGKRNAYCNMKVKRFSVIERFVHLGDVDYEELVCTLARHPVPAVVVICDDFMSYKSGLYTGPIADDTGTFMCIGYHALLLYGYGKDEETGHYYVMGRSSFGLDWGIGGNIKISFNVLMNGLGLVFGFCYPVLKPSPLLVEF